MNEAMTQEDLSPTVKLAQKSIADNKQVTSIRKITIETLAPIISKLEEQINYLLLQSKEFRSEKTILTYTIANHKLIEKEISQIKEQLINQRAENSKDNEAKEKKIHEANLQENLLRHEIQKLKDKQQSSDRQLRLTQAKNEAYSKEIESHRVHIDKLIENTQSSINTYYENQIRIIERVQIDCHQLKEDIRLIHTSRSFEKQEQLQVNLIAKLYDQERLQWKSMLEECVEAKNNAVYKSQYDYFKKTFKIENEMLLKNVQKVMDDALTPQIRSFLPTLIQKLDDLALFQNRFISITTLISEHKKHSEEEISKVEIRFNEIRNTLEAHERQSMQMSSELSNKLQEEVELLRSEINSNKNLMYESERNTSEMMNEIVGNMARSMEQKFKGSLAETERCLEKMITHNKEHFIDQHKQAIYQTVLSIIPPEEKALYDSIKSTFIQLEPLLASIKLDIAKCNTALEENSNSILSQLKLFSNQIVKLKSDAKLESLKNQKDISSWDWKLNQIKEIIQQNQDILFKYAESIHILLCSSINEAQITKDQVFVGYHDGIFYQVNLQAIYQKDTQKRANYQDTITYRKKVLNRNYLKKALLSELIKELDNFILQRGAQNYPKNKKPSYFFSQTILKKYLQYSETESEYKLGVIYASKNQNNLAIQQKSSNKKSHSKSFRENMSKTIQVDKNNSSNEIQEDGKRYHEANSIEYVNFQNRKNIRIKKVEK